MKKRIIVVLSVLLVLCSVLTGCNSDKIRFKQENVSRDYLIGYEYSGGYGSMWDTAKKDIIITNQRQAIIYIDDMEIARVPIDKDSFAVIKEGIKQKDIANMKVETNELVKNGVSEYIIIYNRDNEPYITKGGYVPSGKKFVQYKELIINNVGWENLQGVIDAYTEEQKIMYEEFQRKNNRFNNNGEEKKNPYVKDEEEN